MTIRELIQQHAKSGGFTAICGDECGCKIDGDFEPCGMINIRECQFGHWITCECGQEFASPLRDETLCPACRERFGDLDEFARQGEIAWADVPDAAQWQREQRGEE